MTPEERKAYNREQKARRRAAEREASPVEPIEELEDHEPYPELRLSHAILDLVAHDKRWDEIDDFDGPAADAVADISVKIAHIIADAVADIARTELADTRTDDADIRGQDADRTRTVDSSVSSSLVREPTKGRSVRSPREALRPVSALADTLSADADTRTNGARTDELSKRIGALAGMLAELLDGLARIEARIERIEQWMTDTEPTRVSPPSSASARGYGVNKRRSRTR